MYIGDLALGVTFDHYFTTRRFSTGAPHTLAGTPVVSAYEDNGTTEITAGITLTADFDSRTGLNHLRVVATSGNGFESGKSYYLVITTGTVDSVSVVGEVIGSFTIERGAAFGRLGAPAGASVSADIASIKTDTGTTIPGRLPAALVSGRMDSSVGAMASGVLTATAIAADAITAAKVADGTIDAATFAAGAINAAAIAADAITDAKVAADVTIASVTGAVGSVTGNVGGNVVGSVGSIATGGIAAASFAAGAIDAAAIAADAIGASEIAANAIDASALAADAVAEIADGVWDEATSGHTSAATYGDKLGAHIAGVLKLVVGTGSTTTALVFSTVDGAAPSATNDFYNGRVVVFTSGTLAGQATSISDYVGATTTATIVATTSAASNGDTAVIV